MYAAQMYAEQTGNIQVYQLYNKSTWSIKRTLDVADKNCKILTLSVNDDSILCCSMSDNSIDELRLRSRGVKRYTVISGESGKLSAPFICNDDGDGNLIVASRDDNKLLLLREDGKCETIKLREQVREPQGAALLDGYLFVTSVEDKTICKYKPKI